MTPVDVRRRRAGLRAAGRRRPGVPERSGGPERPGGQTRSDADAAPRLFGDCGGSVVEAQPGQEEVPAVRAAGSDPLGRRERATLEELIGRVWEDVLAEERATCPLCGGEIVGRASAHARPTEGRCRECGTTIS